MPNIIDYYEYAKLATAVYVNLDGKPLNGAAVARQPTDRERPRSNSEKQQGHVL